MNGKIEKREIKQEDAIKTLLSLGNISVSFTDLAYNGGFFPSKRIKEILPDSEDYFPTLSLCLINHDLDYPIENLNGFGALLLIAQSKGQVDKVDSLLRERECFVAYESSRIGLLNISYLATGDKKFLAPVQTNLVLDLLSTMYSDAPKWLFDFGNVQTITSDQYLAVHQLVKNAKKWIYQAKKVQPSEPTDETIDVKLNEISSHLVITIKDNGTGILSDKLPLIFGGYTEGGTNIGLRTVKRILDLSGGHAEVISTRNGQDTFKYDTRTNAVKKVAENQPHGTTFTLYFPK